MYRQIGFKHDANNCDMYELYKYFDNQSFNSMYGGSKEYQDLKNIYENRKTPPKTEKIDYSEKYPARIPPTKWDYDDDYDSDHEYTCFGNSYYGVTMKHREKDNNFKTTPKTPWQEVLENPKTCDITKLESFLLNPVTIKKHSGTQFYADLMKICHNRLLEINKNYYYHANKNIEKISIFDFDVAVASKDKVFYYNSYKELLIPNRFNSNLEDRMWYVNALYDYLDSHSYGFDSPVRADVVNLEYYIRTLGDKQVVLPKTLSTNLEVNKKQNNKSSNITSINTNKNNILLFIIISFVLIVLYASACLLFGL